MILVPHKRARQVLSKEACTKQNKLLETLGFRKNRTSFTSIPESKYTHFRDNLAATLPVAYNPKTHLFNSSQVLSDVYSLSSRRVLTADNAHA